MARDGGHRRPRDSPDPKSPTCYVSTFGDVRTSLSVSPTPTQRPNVPIWKDSALCGSLIYQPPSVPAAEMWDLEKRWKMKAREDWFLNVSKTGEQASHLEPTHPNVQHSVYSWLTVLHVNMEPDLKISLAQWHNLVQGNRISCCVGEHVSSLEWNVSGLSDWAHYCIISS